MSDFQLFHSFPLWASSRLKWFCSFKWGQKLFLPSRNILEHYSVLHCTMTLDVQTVVVFSVIVLLLLVNVILMFFLGTR